MDDSSDAELLIAVIVAEKREAAKRLLEKNRMRNLVEGKRRIAIAKRAKKKKERIYEKVKETWHRREKAITEIRRKEADLIRQVEITEEEEANKTEIMQLMDEMVWDVVMSEIDMTSFDEDGGRNVKDRRKRNAKPTRISTRRKRMKPN